MAELQIQNPSITSGAFASMLAFSSDNYTITAISGHPIAGVGGGSTPVEGYWRPSVNTAGDISWAWSLESTSTAPSTANIKGPQGIQGEQGPQGPQGPSGTNGIDGTPGTDGISPIFTTSVTSDEQHPQGGTHVILSGAAGESAFNVWNGVNGEGATVNLLDGTGIHIEHEAGTTNYTIGVSADYATKPTGTGVEDKYWLYSTYTGNSWIEANTWLCNNFICENGISGVPDMSLGKVHIGLSGDYLPTSGGTVSGSTYFSAANGQNMLAVASAATLIGASRQTSEHFGQDTNALGTTWLGVGGAGMYRGFLKYTQGGNVGDLDSNNTMQVEFTPNNKGTIFAKAKNSGNDCPETQILNPTKASCDAMAQSANANLVSGPNYMLAKNADGQFVIGAACVNCTAINDVTLTPNTYYFVYEV